MSQFAQELEALGGAFTSCQRVDLATSLLTRLRELGVEGLLAWEGDHLPPGLLDELVAHGIRISHRADRQQAAPEADVIAPGTAGLTGALAAIAETGTLVLPGGPGMPQVASLLPEVHIAVLRAEHIYAGLREILTLPEVQAAPTVSLVSGPSRTADIEMTLTIGVHGPARVEVFCIEASQ